MEKTITTKDDVIRFLESFQRAVDQNFGVLSEAQLSKSADFFGDPATVRSVYLRIFAHVNELTAGARELCQ